MKKVAIIDYRLGNLFSVVQACKKIGLNAELCSDSENLSNFDGFILPGVGSFKGAMEHMRESGLDKALIAEINNEKPLFGVCLGLQLLFEESEEFGLHKGLGLISGKVKKFPNFDKKGVQLRVPNIGWNEINLNPERLPGISPLDHLINKNYVYFVHSYYVDPSDKNIILTHTEYQSFEYASSIQKNNIFATQFHPEKSGKLGLEIYKNWAINNNLIFL